MFDIFIWLNTTACQKLNLENSCMWQVSQEHVSLYTIRNLQRAGRLLVIHIVRLSNFLRPHWWWSCVPLPWITLQIIKTIIQVSTQQRIKAGFDAWSKPLPLVQCGGISLLGCWRQLSATANMPTARCRLVMVTIIHKTKVYLELRYNWCNFLGFWKLMKTKIIRLLSLYIHWGEVCSVGKRLMWMWAGCSME